MPVICAAIGCNNKFVKGSEIRFYRLVFAGCTDAVKFFGVMLALTLLQLLKSVNLIIA